MEKLENLDGNELAEVYSGQYQGDMIIGKEEMEDYRARKARHDDLIDTEYRWDDALVPYQIVETHFSNQSTGLASFSTKIVFLSAVQQIKQIEKALDAIRDVTCVKFVSFNPKKHRDFITVVGNYSGCFASVGRQGRGQVINLQPHNVEMGCFRRFTIVHMFMHALGFFHTQSATNRDEYIRIEWERIKESDKRHFDKFGADILTSADRHYDYDSVMHSPPTAFSTEDSKPTMVALQSTKAAMGQRSHLSDMDVEKIKSMYCRRYFSSQFEEWAYKTFGSLFD